ncbi:MAG: LPS export ABC transporter permease LptF [Rhodobacterales bacterium]|nr:LPS export ABC transporter permease LptF [Rhodobacterales bacterium]
MARFDRYMLSQLMVLFGFFALVLVSIYWINQAVRLFDSLIGDGQSAFVFIEFTALTLPNVIRLVLPMSAFAGAVYVTNRLSTESELVVMQATGFSPWRLARPVLIYGIIVGTMMAALTHFLVPASKTQFALRKSEISQNVTAKLLSDGAFLHPSEGITFYIREITPEGALEDMFLSDRSTPGQSVTYTATRAYLVRDGESTKLVMIDGLVQSYNTRTGRLFNTHFDDFSYDVGGLVGNAKPNLDNIQFASTLDLIRDPQTIADRANVSYGRVMEELHGRFSQPLLCVVAALIGFSTLLVGGFSRFGVWRQIVAALLLLVGVKIIEGIVADPLRSNEDLWFLVYVPSLVGLAISGALLGFAARPRGPRTRKSGGISQSPPNGAAT